jgi:AcrR family transcriptional regulator
MQRSTRKRLSKEERRKRVLNAALEVFAESGYAGARTQAIASRAGISNALIFQHFASKQELYRSALEFLFDEHPIRSEFDAADSARPVEQVLLELALHLLRHVREDPRIPRLALHLALERSASRRDRADLAWPAGDLVKMLKRFFEQRIDSGELRALDARTAATCFVGAVLLHAIQQTPDGRAAQDDQAEEVAAATLVRIFCSGMLAS